MTRRDHTYYVYILASWTKVLYIGVTNDMETRLYQHRTAGPGNFTGRYRVHRLIPIKEYRWIDDAIAREKQLKGWRRDRKLALIEADNPAWRDLSSDWS